MIYTTKDYNRISYINIYNNIVIADITRMYCYDGNDADQETLLALHELVKNYTHNERTNLVYFNNKWQPIENLDLDLLDFIDQCRRTLKGDYRA
ncbi:hypothetical protein fHeYen901_149 [Yersinia phage fHe-Yen9-01]|uniref:Uncharacterized protein n=1 Tax=Yersinia phage fHe-Yen9-01 TaxID=1965363 RepID=A0A1V0DXP0_9CAUD|nr:hypothetical protein KNT60_gp148 [Yersinia phage fHe-Yen9-01]ARB05922.1 hypothetical protein fHeYen901_149 [Yersinia phage fHe-Yen9-01]